jgi:hypothetical protein
MATNLKQENTQGTAFASTFGAHKLDIIWNVTLVCPWTCAICCVDAVHVMKRDGKVVLESQGLSVVEEIPYIDGRGSIFDQALRFRQQQGLELDLAGKLRVLDHLDGAKVKLDVSGGDVLAASENVAVLHAASERFGREQITLTATGAGTAGRDIAEVGELIGEYNFTYDNPSFNGNVTRPDGYAVGNLRRAAQFSRLGVRTRAECPLTAVNCAADALLTQLYLNLHEAGIGKLLLMRLFPVGRGTKQASAIPSPDQYRHAIDLLRNLEAKYGGPALKLQCALKFFDPVAMQTVDGNPCDLIHESFGLTPNGTLLVSPWAINAVGRPLDEAFVLGNLATTPIGEILNSEKVQAYRARLEENFGHCKLLAYFHSRKLQAAERLFDAADPLYVAHVQPERVA